MAPLVSIADSSVHTLHKSDMKQAEAQFFNKYLVAYFRCYCSSFFKQRLIFFSLAKAPEFNLLRVPTRNMTDSTFYYAHRSSV